MLNTNMNTNGQTQYYPQALPMNYHPAPIIMQPPKSNNYYAKVIGCFLLFFFGITFFLGFWMLFGYKGANAMSEIEALIILVMGTISLGFSALCWKD